MTQQPSRRLSDPTPDARLLMPPVLYRADGNVASLVNLYQGQSAFLICGGPSIRAQDLSVLARRGVLTCSVNNAAAVFRTNLWVSVDPPRDFCDAIWRDPTVTKFVPLARMNETTRVRNTEGELVDSLEKVSDMPGVFGLRLQSGFRADCFLSEPLFTWGNDSGQTDDDGNSTIRSVMFVALKLLFVLGVTRIYLLGCDFRMRYGDRNYAFEQHRTRKAVQWNNRSYRVLSARLATLKPFLEAAGCTIWNCTSKSGLKVFEHVDLEHAVDDVLKNFPRVIQTEGMYDPPARDKPVDLLEQWLRQHSERHTASKTSSVTSRST